jgi:hypothetical protein
MRVAYLCADFGIPIRGHKGASVHVRELVGALASDGHEVLLVSPAPGEGNALDDHATLRVIEPGRLSQQIRAFLGRTVGKVAPRVPNEARELLYNATLYCDGLRVLEEFGPEMIYERYSLFNLAGIALARRLGIPHLLEVNAPLRLERARTKGVALPRAAALAERLLLTASDGVFAVSAPLAR